MHRIDGPAAAPGGLFTEGDPAVGTPATVVTDDWLNAVQTELENVATAAGAALSKPNNAQVLQAILALIGRAVPVGQVIQGYFASAPQGFLICDGSLVGRAAYPALFAHAQSAGLVVAEAAWSATTWTSFGAGDGVATFRLPDLRGEFVRGADLGRGVDAGRGLGTWQPPQIQAHAHGGVPQLTNDTDRGTGNFSRFSVDDVGETSPSGGGETRGRNAALTFCVRF